MEVSIEPEKVLSFIRGGEELDVRSIAKNRPEILARSIAYLLKKKYHRVRMCTALLNLINQAPPNYRGIAWSLIQDVPISFLLNIVKVIKNGKNSRRLRHAMVNKLANTNRKDLIRAFFIAPNLFRSLFTDLYIPREKFNDKQITNERYQFAFKLSTLSVPEALKELKLGKSDLLQKFNIPLETLMSMIESGKEAIDLARVLSSDNFFRHGRWFKNIIGDEEYERISLEKMVDVKNPIAFLSIKDHLEATGVLTPRLTEEFDKKANEILDELMKDFDLERLALIVDVSGSMHVAINITTKLYEAFSRMAKITDLIAFNNAAFGISLDRLRQFIPDGMTSIGSAIVLLHKKLDERKKDIPQAIIMVSDLEENTSPMLEPSLKLLEKFGNPPLIVVHCGAKRKLKIDYPSAILPVDDFHSSLVMDLMKQIARYTSKVIEEKEITEIVKQRRPIEEELGEIELPERPPETLAKGYLENLLCKK